MAFQFARPYEYRQGKFKKERFIQELIQKDRLDAGLVAVLCLQETCRSVKLRYGKQKPRLIFAPPASAGAVLLLARRQFRPDVPASANLVPLSPCKFMSTATTGWRGRRANGDWGTCSTTMAAICNCMCSGIKVCSRIMQHKPTSSNPNSPCLSARAE